MPAIAPGTPSDVSVGPTARTIRFLGTVPPTTNPAIRSCAPDPTVPRVEMFLMTPSLNVPPDTLAARIRPPGPPVSVAFRNPVDGSTVPAIVLFEGVTIEKAPLESTVLSPASANEPWLT